MDPRHSLRYHIRVYVSPGHEAFPHLKVGEDLLRRGIPVGGVEGDHGLEVPVVPQLVPGGGRLLRGILRQAHQLHCLNR